MKKVKYYGVAKVEYPKNMHPICDRDTISSVIWESREDALRDLVRHASSMLTPKLYLDMIYDGYMCLKDKTTDRIVVDVFIYEVNQIMSPGEELPSGKDDIE